MTPLTTPGLYWHVHHDQLWEYCYDPAGRRAYIKAKKPRRERALRLRLMQPVRGVLGDAALRTAYDQAGAATGQARTALSCVASFCSS